MNKLLAIILLTATYLLALASADPLDALTGLVVSTILVFGFWDFLRGDLDSPPGPPLISRIVHFPWFAAGVLKEITAGTWQVALIVLGIRRLHQPGIVQIPFGERSPTGVVTTALAITLSPGELLIEIDEERRVLLLHVLDARDPDAVRDHHERFFQRYQRKVFP